MYYSQTDPAWSNEDLGTSTVTIGNAGCAVVAVADLGVAVGHSVGTPADVNNWLKANGGFADENLLVWAAVPKLVTNVTDQGTTDNEAQLNTFLASEPNFAIVEYQVGDHLHFCMAPLVGTIIDSEDGVEKPMSTYTFKMAHLYTKNGTPAPDIAPTGVATVVREAAVRVAPNTSALEAGSMVLATGSQFVYKNVVTGQNVTENGVTSDQWAVSQFGHFVWSGNLTLKAN